MINFKLLKNAVYIDGVVALSDLHIGYEASLIASGVLIPGLEEKEIIKEINELFSELKKEKLKVREIVICGDLKHKFGGFSLEEWKSVRRVLDVLKSYGKIILVRGNHDSYLEALKDQYEIRDYYVKNGVCFLHGDKIFERLNDVEMLIMGDVHPIVVLKEEAKSESYKCFLRGKYKGKEVLVLPAFNPLIETGWNVSVGEVRGISIKNFEVYAVGDKAYKFGKVGKLAFND